MTDEWRVNVLSMSGWHGHRMGEGLDKKTL
jgi:hypothetical protein